MKRIKKITASLLALAITAAGMSSIIAHAQSQSVPVQFSNPNEYLTATLIYTRGVEYSAVTSGSSYYVIHRRVYCSLKHTAGELYAPTNQYYSYQGIAYMGFSNIPSYITVNHFHSDHSARYKYNNQFKSHQYDIY